MKHSQHHALQFQAVGAAAADRQRLDALTQEMEALAQRDPEAYRRRVSKAAALGSAYMVAMVVVIVAGLAGLGWLLVEAEVWSLIALIGSTGLFLLLVLRSLWLGGALPGGHPIRADEAPELFALIDDLRRQLDLPPFRRVLIDDYFNAGVVPLGGFGVPGWQDNYLYIGLPLLKCLSRAQLKAVLAHEMGHLVRSKGNLLEHRIYRQRVRWERLMAAMEASQNVGAMLVMPFLRRYVPYFDALSFPLAKASEYEADRASVRMTSPTVTAEALTVGLVGGLFVAERYWPDLFKRAADEPEPPAGPFRTMGSALAAAWGTDAVQVMLREALGREMPVGDTHPPLAERLKAIGVDPKLAPPAPGETADALLGPALEVVTSEMDTLWKKLYQQRWAALHAEAQAARQQAADLDARVAAGETLSVAEALRRAELTAARDAAITQFRAICAASPDNAKASLGLATRLLEGDDESGCALAEQAMRLDPELSLEACLLLRDYYWRQGNVALAREWEHRTATRADVEQRASNERATVSLSDHFERNDLPPEALAALVAQLKAVPGLHHAYLVKKRVEVLAQRSCYILGVEVTRWYHLPSRTRVPAVLAAIQKQVNLPQHTLVMPVDGDNYRFGRKFYWMKGARIM